MRVCSGLSGAAFVNAAGGRCLCREQVPRTGECMSSTEAGGGSTGWGR